MIIIGRNLSKVMLLELWLSFILAHLFPLVKHSQSSIASFPQGASFIPIWFFKHFANKFIQERSPLGILFSFFWSSLIQGVVIAWPLGNVQVVWIIVMVEVFLLSPSLLFHSSSIISICFSLFAYNNLLHDRLGSSNLIRHQQGAWY